MRKTSPSKTPPPADYLSQMRKVAEENLRLKEARQKLQEENERLQSQLEGVQAEPQKLLTELHDLHAKLQTSNASAISSFNKISALLNIPGISEEALTESQIDNPAIVPGKPPKRPAHKNNSEDGRLPKRIKININTGPNSNGDGVNQDASIKPTTPSLKTGPS